MDAKDLLVHSPRVISNTTNRMYGIKLLRYGHRSAPAGSGASRGTVAGNA